MNEEIEITPEYEFEPCEICGNDEPNYDGFCSHCEKPMTAKVIPNT